VTKSWQRKFILTAILALFCANSRAQSISLLVIEVTDLAKKLSEFPHLTDDSTYLVAKFGRIGADVTADKSKELISDVASDGKVKNIEGHLRSIYRDGEEALKIVGTVNSDLPDTPDFSHLSYCDQAAASANQIARIEDTINNLNKLAEYAKSYKIIISSLDQMKTVLGNVFAKLSPLDTLPIVGSEATVGTFTQEMFFFTDNGAAASSGDDNANFLLSHAKDDWDNVEKQAVEKAQKLRKTLDVRKAFDQHFYRLAAEKCADDRAKAAALASMGGSISLVPQTPLHISGSDPCQAAQQQVATFLATCMQAQASSMCANFTTTANCYSRAQGMCGSCVSCSSQFQSAAAQARASAQQVCVR
jgi:hypothetical protein